MKKLGIVFSLCLSMLLFAGCGNDSMSNSSSATSKGFQTTGRNVDGEYQGVIEDGHYLTSKSRGVVLVKDSENILNLQSFERGLLNISKQEFSPKKYIFQEGQVLNKSTVYKWLGRKTKKNTLGLNPKDNGSKDPKKRNPMYVQAISEQDYMQKDDNDKLVLSGMTIGIAMNRKDYYQKEEYGATYISDISKEKMLQEGRIAAAKVLARLRQMKDVPKNIPIVIAMFEQAPQDSLVGGTIYAYTVSKKGAELGSWTETDYQSCVFPATDGKKVPNDNDEESFLNFKNKVQNFFPNLAGVTAQAYYEGKTLQGLNINITTQFYSQTEVISFTQYITRAAKQYLPANVPLNIKVRGSDGNVQSFVSHQQRGDDYYTHVFGSY